MTFNTMRYVDVSHALSLNNVYWITKDDIDHKWEDYNYMTITLIKASLW